MALCAFQRQALLLCLAMFLRASHGAPEVDPAFGAPANLVSQVAQLRGTLRGTDSAAGAAVTSAAQPEHEEPDHTDPAESVQEVKEVEEGAGLAKDGEQEGPTPARRLRTCKPVQGMCWVSAQCCSGRCVGHNRCGPRIR